MNIFFLCRSKDYTRERLGYRDALARLGVRLLCLDDVPAAAGDVRVLADDGPNRPSLIVHPDPPDPFLPEGLADVPIPTAIFQIDNYVAARRRARWSLLFDYAVLLHPGYRALYLQEGHPAPIDFLHCIDGASYSAELPPKDIEVASVGQTNSRMYRARKLYLSALRHQFVTNEWWRSHDPREVPGVYRRSKIVLNIGRDDYAIDVSLRFAEAMAAGALFATRSPSELSLMGFVEGEHYVSFRDPAEMVALCRYYIDHEDKRARIANAGRRKVLGEHTFENRARQLGELASAGRLVAPARLWPPHRVRLTYLDYHAAHGSLGDAFRDLGGVGSSDPRATMLAVSLIGRAIGRRVLSAPSRAAGKLRTRLRGLPDRTR
jgi:hypothetical protein